MTILLIQNVLKTYRGSSVSLFLCGHFFLSIPLFLFTFCSCFFFFSPQQMFSLALPWFPPAGLFYPNWPQYKHEEYCYYVYCIKWKRYASPATLFKAQYSHFFLKFFRYKKWSPTYFILSKDALRKNGNQETSHRLQRNSIKCYTGIKTISPWI